MANILLLQIVYNVALIAVIVAVFRNPFCVRRIVYHAYESIQILENELEILVKCTGV